MRILNFGSLNLDYVYSVDHIVQPGETLSSSGLEIFSGGKGLNQSVALARAGATVFHAGMVGADGGQLLQVCKENGVDTRHIRTVSERSGNAIIQVTARGQNSIILFGGANQQNDSQHIRKVMEDFGEGDLLLLQNEINLLDEIIERAAAKGMRIALNPSPYNESIVSCDLGKVSIFLINEVEGEQITGRTQPEEIISAMKERYPAAGIVLTLGKRGVVYSQDDKLYRHGIYDVPVVDTTAAGDTFTGYFLCSLVENREPGEALLRASVASSLAVSKKGATASIPWACEVDAADLKLI